jgi:hypothetical protein
MTLYHDATAREAPTAGSGIEARQRNKRAIILSMRNGGVRQSRRQFATTDIMAT